MLKPFILSLSSQAEIRKAPDDSSYLLLKSKSNTECIDIYERIITGNITTDFLPVIEIKKTSSGLEFPTLVTVVSKTPRQGITSFRVPLHSPICSLSLLFSPTKISTNKIFLTFKKKKLPGKTASCEQKYGND
jgi:hypothetical protein